MLADFCCCCCYFPHVDLKNDFFSSMPSEKWWSCPLSRLWLWGWLWGNGNSAFVCWRGEALKLLIVLNDSYSLPYLNPLVLPYLISLLFLVLKAPRSLWEANGSELSLCWDPVIQCSCCGNSHLSSYSLLLLHKCNFSTFMNYNIHIWRDKNLLNRLWPISWEPLL